LSGLTVRMYNDVLFSGSKTDFKKSVLKYLVNQKYEMEYTVQYIFRTCAIIHKQRIFNSTERYESCRSSPRKPQMHRLPLRSPVSFCMLLCQHVLFLSYFTSASRAMKINSSAKVAKPTRDVTRGRHLNPFSHGVGHIGHALL
jgi:hypothetical protein